MHVDWEERVDFRRLHAYRLGRAQQAIAKAGLGAVLAFDMNNIRYITSRSSGILAPRRRPTACTRLGPSRKTREPA